MGKKQRKPRFFCDGCGTEVSADAYKCPQCGKFFASMRCPRCGFCGEYSEFRKGCPNCGYAAPGSKPQRPIRPQSPPHTSAGGVQPVYILSVAALVLILTIFLVYILR
jgi:predicted RNA-binding Zn-ribbon protein involved in translation (DUF1610 family)